MKRVLQENIYKRKKVQQHNKKVQEPNITKRCDIKRVHREKSSG